MAITTNPRVNGGCNLVNTPVMATDFGGYWDGTNDDTSAIQAAVTYAATFSPRKNVVLPNNVCIKSSIFVPKRVHIYGADYSMGHINTVITPHASMSLSTGFMFNGNTTDGLSATTTPALGDNWECGIFGCWLSNASPNVAGASLYLFCGTFIAEDIRGYHHTQLFKKLSGLYVDNIHIERINVGLSYDNSLYGIEIPTGGGDALHIKNINCPTGASTPEKVISITGSYGAQIEDVINGSIYLDSVAVVGITNYHSELGSITGVNSNIAIRDSEWQVPSAQTYYPIDMQISGGTTTTYTLETDNVYFTYGMGDGTSESTNAADIRLSFQYAFYPKNTRRIINMYGSQRSLQGIRLEKQDDTPLTVWNQWSHFLSDGGKWIGNLPFGSLNVRIDTSPGSDDFQGITATALSTSSQYGSSTLAASTTYYYTSQLLFDSTSGALSGRNQASAEASRATGTGTNKRISLTVGYGNCTPIGIVRIYRGTSTGSYGFYADIPSIKCVQMVDKGDYINGVPWVDRGGASAVTALNTTLTDGTWIQTPNGKVAVS